MTLIKRFISMTGLVAVFLSFAMMPPSVSLVYSDEKPEKKFTADVADSTVKKGESHKKTEPADVMNNDENNEENNTQAANNDAADEKEEQDIMEDALALLEESQEYWNKGDIESALELLDQAYSLILDTDGDPAIARQKDDVRLLISKRILAIYNSMHTATSGKRSEIPLVMNEDVQYEIKMFQTREREFFINSYNRSGLYRPTIVKELKKAGIPEELSWLPLVESGFKITALSPARALGLWQFIPSTGYKYGMSRDEWIDERMDVDKSTKAAIGYLKDLHGMFGDWLTGLAAYNCGEGRIMRVISRQHLNYLDHFWDLYRQLPRETARYVPRFLATLHIIKDPKKYGMDLGTPKEKPMSYEKVKSTKSMKLEDIATKLNISEDVLTFLNPELKHKATPDREYELKVPLEMAEKFAAVADEIPKLERPKQLSYSASSRSVVRHKVRRGETLASIARKYGTSVGAIRDYNHLAARRGVVQGQRVIVPVRERRVVSDHASNHSSTVRAKQAGKVSTHHVKKGETLISVSKRYNMTVPEIKKMNGMKNNVLKPGQIIKVSYQTKEISPAKTKKKVVKKKLARKNTARRNID